MSTTFCSVCLGNLIEPPVPGEPDIVAITPPTGFAVCGHVLHRHCAGKIIATSDNINPPKCPLCRAAFTFDDLRNVYLEVKDPNCENCENSKELVKSLQGALKKKDDRISKLRAELESLKLEQSENYDGSRIHLKRIFGDSKCFNCESKEHTSMACPNNPYLRCIESTKYEKWAPIQKFKLFAKIPFESETAGTMISFYARKLKLWKPSRLMIQAFIGFSFFDDCCWNCASPYHHRGECKNGDLGIKGLCKQLHEVNHPLTQDAAASKAYFRERALMASP